MTVYYDDKIDTVYLKLGEEKPDGVVEIAEGVNLDTISDGKLAGIEILKALQKIDIRTILSYSLELDKNIFLKKLLNRLGIYAPGRRYRNREGIHQRDTR